MNILADLAQRVVALEAKQNTLILEAVVTRVRADENLVDVDVLGKPLKEIPYLTERAGKKGKTYWMPEVGESGLLLSPGGNIGNARFMPALNTNENEPLDNDPDKMIIEQGQARIEATPDMLKVEFQTMKIEIKPTSIEMRTPTTFVVVTPALVNVNGATFAAGVTNLLAGSIPITYIPIPA